MSNFIKNLSAHAALTSTDLLAVSDATAQNLEKTTLQDVTNYIGTGGINPPIVLGDKDPFTTATGTLSVVGSTGAATLTNSTDHANIQEGDILLIDGGVTDGAVNNIVTVKGVFPNLTLLPSLNASARTFSYGKASIVSKDSSGNIKASISTGGLNTVGSIISNNSSSFRDGVGIKNGLLVDDVTAINVDADTVFTEEVRSKSGVGHVDLKPYDDSLISQRNFDDGMVATPYQPAFRADMSANQTALPGGVWTKVNFDSVVINRVPSGFSGYDATNKVFAVPYGSYSPGSNYQMYTLSTMVRFNFPITAQAKVEVMILGTSSPTATSGVTLFLREHDFFASGGTRNIWMNTGCTGSLHLIPEVVANHRYISVWVKPSTTPFGLYFTSGYSWFSGICHG
jgi:hypothetical protein